MTELRKQAPSRHKQAKAHRNGGRSAVVDRSKWPICSICLDEQKIYDETFEHREATWQRPPGRPHRWYVRMYNEKMWPPIEMWLCGEHLSIVESGGPGHTKVGKYAYDHYEIWESAYDPDAKPPKKAWAYAQQSGRAYNGNSPAVFEDGSINENAWVKATNDNEHDS